MDIDDDVNTDIVDHNEREDERREATGNHKGLSGLVQEVVRRDVTRGIDMSSYREEREAEDQEEGVEADQPRDNFGAGAGPNIKSEPDGVVSVHAHRSIAAATNTWHPDNTTTSTKSEAHSSQSQTRHAGSKHSAEGTSQEGLPSKALRTKRETIKKAPKVYPPRKPRARPVALEPVTMTIRTDSALSTLASAAVAIKNRQEDASILSHRRRRPYGLEAEGHLKPTFHTTLEATAVTCALARDSDEFTI
ncbi:hypothetical protein BGZ98_005578 [Dissophora globulifera]|nr:hypothetical protein BGZ98_005578 [Dissophora globulifera]